MHLSETYDFLRSAHSGLDLNQQKLLKLHQDLDIDTVELKFDDLEYIALTTKDGIYLKIVEDGLIVLRDDCRDDVDLPKEIKRLTDYYEQKLSPAFSYLFSLGAPVPKELANIRTVYPYFVVLKNAPASEAAELLQRFEQEKYSEVTTSNFDIVRGDKFYIINIKTSTEAAVSRFIEEQIFLREFKGQLHHYINLHRTIWMRIAEVKERGTIKGNEVGDFQKKVEAYAKTINLIEARINQMDTYLHTREQIAQSDSRLKDFSFVIEYRYETLGNTLEYVQDIWKMTGKYVDSALELFTDLRAKATQGSVKDLAIITSMGVGATLIGLITKDEAPVVTIAGIGYFAILVIVGYGANKSLKWSARRKNYKISDVEFDKNID